MKRNSKCPKCNNNFAYYEEPQVPGNRDREDLICPWCGEKIGSSMEWEYISVEKELTTTQRNNGGKNMSIKYKSFCWGIGTTSFRTKDFNRTIEEQLSLLDEFWGIEENSKVEWANNNNIQTKYYEFMQEKWFLDGDADNKPKDAREKTSGLVDIGLIDDNRRLTNAGKALLLISKSGDFSSDNHFDIPKDSFIYLKQLLKTFNRVNGNIVRPFIVMLYVISQLGEISLDEFTYLLPLCIIK